jgi:4-amino-4-deoxy-L-arabinose transferase-like glycosyltransferase
VILLWVVLFVPRYDFPSLYDEEGRRALLARDVLERGDWLRPRVLGLRYVSKPPLIPWLIAGTAWLSGGVGELAVRLPSMLASLVGGMLVFGLAHRQLPAGWSILATGVFFLSPNVFSASTRGVADATVTTACFAAFVLWWARGEDDRPSTLNWLGCGALLSVAALAKGPIPLGFFVAGVLGFTAATRRWRDLSGLAVALGLPALVLGAWALAVFQPGDGHTWFREMRLDARPRDVVDYVVAKGSLSRRVVDLMPSALVVVPALVPAVRRRWGGSRALAVALLCYAGFAGAVVLWPTAQPRHVIPAAPALAVLAGLAAAQLWRRGRMPDRVLLGLATLWAAHLFLSASILRPLSREAALLTAAGPPRQEDYSASRRGGAELSRMLATAPGPVYFLGPPGPHDYNVLAYVDRSILALRPREWHAVTAPAWVIARPERLDGIRQVLPDLALAPVTVVAVQHGRRFVVLRRGSPP